jgi:putative DNA primase/helicase
MATKETVDNLIDIAARRKKMRDAEPQDGELSPSAEDSLALSYADRHAHEFRYVAAWGRWLRYDGTRWNFDDTLDAFDRARAICREVATGCKPRIAAAVASAKTVAAVERLAKADRRLAATANQWDTDRWLLGTPKGTVDLRDGKMRPATAGDYITKLTAVAPDGDCPLWKVFLTRVTGEDQTLQDYLQRASGYALTGCTNEDVLFFCYGTGANGKSVFIKTIAGILGDYHKTAPMETFTVSTGDRHPTDLAMLRGARLVSAIETEEGKRWDEAKIKSLTGGDRISARFMRQDFFEYTPQFKLMIAGNHRPRIRTVDEAIRRRMNLIPFTVTIPKDQRDLELAEKLKAEWPGILRWMIDGCLTWQRSGLQPPAIVNAATKEYLESQDALHSWIQECCQRDPKCTDTIANLWAGWKGWAETNGEYVGSKRSLGDKLEDKGFARVKGAGGKRQYGGIQFVGDSFTCKED